MRVTHSLLHAGDLAQLVERDYAIAAPVTVSLLNRGFNDTYLVTDAEGGRRVLRVYNRDKYWIRSESDLRFELDLLEHLAAAGLGVTRPYQRTLGDRLGRLTAPEGERCFALFTYAPGAPLYEGALTAEQWREFGSDIARMHQEMDAFPTRHDRYHLDERLLVERPLASLAPYAGSGQAAADLAELGKLGERLTDEIQRLRAIRGAYGIIHADWLGAADRTGDAWVTEARIARLLADVRKAESDPTPRLATRAQSRCVEVDPPVTTTP